MIPHLIFDFDGTLVDSAPDILETFERAFAEHGWLPQRRIDHDVIGPPLPKTLEFLGPHLTEVERAAVATTFRRIYDASTLPRTVPYAGTEEFLRELRQSGRKLFIATNKRALPVQKLVERYSWRQYFDDILCTDSLGPPVTPKSELLAEILRRHRLSALDAVMVGDTLGDIEAARANSMDTAYLRHGYGNDAEASAARWIFDDIQGLRAWALKT